MPGIVKELQMNRGMKKAIVICLLVLLVFATGCSDDNATGPAPPAAEQQTEGVELLSGYPKDVLPLFKARFVESTSFAVRADANWVFGKDIYNVSYTSDADLKDVMEYYKGLLTEMDEEYSNDESLQGMIGEQPVGVMVYETEDGESQVSLIIGSKPSEYVTENPYFVNYPSDLVEPFGRAAFSEQRYEVRNYSRLEEVYTESHVTNVTEEEFKDFYSAKYSGADNLIENDHEYGLEFQWTSQGYVCRSTISNYDGPGDEWVTIIVSREI